MNYTQKDNMGSVIIQNSNESNFHPLIEVFEAVLQYGPILLDDLYPRTSRTRSSAYRCLKHLERAGWVRVNMDKKNYVVAGAFVENTRECRCSNFDIDLIASSLLQICKAAQVNVEIGIFQNSNDFKIMDWTARSETALQPPAIETCDTLLVAVCIVSTPHRRRYVLDPTRGSGFTPFIGEVETRISECIRQLNSCGYYTNRLSEVSTIGLLSNAGTVGAITVSPRQYRATSNRETYLDAVKQIRDLLFRHNMLGKPSTAATCWG